VDKWKETTLGEVANVQTGPFGSQLHEADYVAEGTPIITVENLVNDYINHSSSTPKVSNDDRARLARYTLNEGDIVFSRVGSVDRCGYVSEKEDGWLFSGRLLRVRSEKSVFSKYVFYWMSQYRIKEYVRKIAVGATMPSINTELISQVPITYPPLPEQKAIAAVLSSFDDKIELLRRQNKTLEKIGQTIFKEWFVNFTVNGKKLKVNHKTNLPEGWRMTKLGDELSVAIGGDWGKETKTNKDDIRAYCLRGTDIDSLKLNGYSSQVPTRWIRKDSLNKRTITENDIIIGGSGLGPIGKTIYCHANINLLYDLPMTYSNFCKRLTAKNKYCALYFEHLISRLYNQGGLERFFIGTSIPNLDINGLLEEMVIIPSEKRIEDLAKILEFKYAKLINPQIQTLSKLRDTLLPKLMKGEIRVKDTEIFAKEKIK